MNDAYVRDPKGAAGKARRILWSALFGVAFGALFPLVSTIIALLDAGQTMTLRNALALHKALPLLQVIDTIPLLLGLAFGLLGRAMARLDDFIENLEGTVAQRDLVLQKAQNQATAARKAKGALLGQFAERMRNEFAKVDSPMKTLLNAGMPLEVQRPLKAVANTQRKVSALLWNLEMLANVEDEASHPSQGELCHPIQLCEQIADNFAQRTPGGVQYKIRAGHDVPREVQLSTERLARTLSCLLQCAVERAAQKHLEITLSHFAASHGGTSQLHVAIRNPSTPTTNSVVRSFSDLDPNSKGSKERGELELALCRQLALTHHGDVGVRADPKGGMSYWLIFPYFVEDHLAPGNPEHTNTDSQETVETRIAQAS